MCKATGNSVANEFPEGKPERFHRPETVRVPHVNNRLWLLNKNATKADGRTKGIDV